MSPRATLWRTAWGFLAVCVGGALAVVVYQTYVESGAAPTIGPSNRQAASEFVERWEGWRRSTASFTELTERVSGEQQLEERVQIAQRFPDRVVRSGDDVSARIDGRLIGCSEATVTSPARCVDNGSFAPDEEVELELDEIRALITGTSPHYRVSRTGPECFRLRRVVSELRPYWGDRADICFDESTGVAKSETTITGPLTITVRRTDISGAVTDGDLALPVPVR